MNKKKNTITISESDIKNMVKNVINEISWQKANDAADMAEDNDVFGRVINNLEDAVEEFDSAIDMYNSERSACGIMQRNSGMMKYFKETTKMRYFREQLQKLYNEMKAYYDRKTAQIDNLRDLADKKFKDEHEGMNMSDYENNSPEEYNDMNDKQKELYNYLYK